MANEIQLKAATGQTLYTLIQSPPSSTLLVTRLAFETTNPADLANYVIPLTESVAGSGVYFGSVPGIADGTYLLPVYLQSGTVPATTDSLLDVCDGQTGGLVLVLSWLSRKVQSLAPLGAPVPRSSHPIALPQQQYSVRTAQTILDALYAARLTLATSGIVSVTIDGQAVSFTSPSDLDRQIREWERRVALLTGRRRRVNSIRLDRFI